MKKLFAISLAVLMVLSLAACGTKDVTDAPSTNPTTTAPVVAGPENSLEVLNNIWALYTDPETTPFVMGGSVNDEGMPAGDGVPGAYDSAKLDGLSGVLYIPEAEIANIDDAATAMHAMMANNFTAGVVRCTGDVNAFAKTMEETLKNNQWICGQPETLVVAVVGGNYVVVAFGVNDLISPFYTNLTTAYAEAQIVYNGSLF